MLEDPAWIVVKVRADPDLAGEALRRATPDLLALDGGWESAPGLSPGMTNNPKGVYGVTYMPDGASVAVDGGAVPDEMLARIPDVVTRHLEELGVRDAVIGEPMRSGGPLFNVVSEYKIRSVAVHLFASPPEYATPMPEGWAEAASEWVRRGLPGDRPLWSEAGSILFTVSAGDVPVLIEQTRHRGSDCSFFAGAPPSWPPGDCYPPKGWNWEQIEADATERAGGRFRAAWMSFGGVAITQMVLSAGGPEATDQDLDALTGELTAVARRFSAGVAYAYVSIATGWGSRALTSGHWGVSGGKASYLLTRVCDEVVFDAFAYQVIGPGHLARLGGALPGAEPLASGRVGLAIGEPSDWLLDAYDQAGAETPSWRTRDPMVRRRGWDLLRPCLVTDDEPAPYRPPPVAKQEPQ